MREKRYSKDMKGTQGKKEERYPFLDVFPLKRKAIREINEREGGFEEAGLELEETERGNYTMAFSIKGKLII